MCRIFKRSVNLLIGYDEVRFLCLKNIRYLFLRIPADDREPGALHLNHDLKAPFKYMVDRMQIDVFLTDLTWLYGLRLSKGKMNDPAVFIIFDSGKIP